MRTAGQFLQDTPFSDGNIFLGPGDFIGGTAALPTNVTVGAGNGLYYYNLNGSATTYNFTANLSSILRTGTAPNYQEQFGTAALKPGPSSVANTSDPLNLVGMPPIKKASLATLTGGPNGYVVKGIQINWIDVIYATGANALASANIAITATSFINNAAPIVTSFVTWGQNGLPLGAQVNPYVARVSVAAPSFVVAADSTLQILLQLVTAATGSTSFYGINVGISYNYN